MNRDHETINQYLDWYESLLTEKQKDVMSMYYRDDFSLAEIAENMDISRSAVSDLIRRVSKTLEEYESKLHLVEKYEARSQYYEELKNLNLEEVNQIVDALYEYE